MRINNLMQHNMRMRCAKIHLSRLALTALILTAPSSGCFKHKNPALPVKSEETRQTDNKPQKPPKYAVPAYVEEQERDTLAFNNCLAELEKVRDGVIKYLADNSDTWPAGFEEKGLHPVDMMCNYILPGYNNYEECVGKVEEEGNKACDIMNYVEEGERNEEGYIRLSITGEPKTRELCLICVTRNNTSANTIEECLSKPTLCR